MTGKPAPTTPAAPPLTAMSTDQLYRQFDALLAEMRRRGEGDKSKPLRQRMVDELAELHMEDVYRHQRKLAGPGPHPTRGFRRQPVRME